MPDMTGGFARLAVTSVVVAGAAFGLATPSHAAEREVPVSAVSGAHELAELAAPVARGMEAANQGHYL
ncbi:MULTISPECIES: hypothetical protein [unclassified Kitasatospora]|uniref:hypothetical protein n=1 Tax=unclassified Kitasatospora TaxID=2633591 RepID=UPI0033DF92E7